MIESILISFCNVWKPPEPPKMSFNLAIYRLSDGEMFPVEIAGNVPVAVGITGLASNERYVFLATQPVPVIEGDGGRFDPGCLLVLDRSNLRLLTVYPFRCAKDPHSLCWFEGRLYLASSGSDEVLEMILDGPRVISETCRWRIDPAGPSEDVHHLNGLFASSDGLLVSGFGKRSGENWTTATEGFLYNITRDQFVARGLHHPHTPFVMNDGKTILCCESARGAVLRVNDQRRTVLDGYARGICQMGSHIYVATSVARRTSRSTGAPVEQPVLESSCSLHCLRADDLGYVSTVEMVEEIREVYDLLPIILSA